jgi:hypothetical protein
MEKIMEKLEQFSKTWVLTEEEGLELLAFLFSSARIQLDEPCQYASMRLLSAAEMVRDFIRERVSPDTRLVLDGTDEMTTHAQMYTADLEDYTGTLDELCRHFARYLVEKSGLDEVGE